MMARMLQEDQQDSQGRRRHQQLQQRLQDQKSRVRRDLKEQRPKILKGQRIELMPTNAPTS